MGFLFGPSPIRRTLPYLQSCKLIFKDRVKIMEIHYNFYRKNFRQDKSHVPYNVRRHDAHVGLRDFYFWNVPQIQYMNKDVQIVRFNEMTPNPFIRCWLNDGSDVLFDCDSQSKEDILARLIKIFGKTQEMIEYEAATDVKQTSEDNTAIFGVDRKRFCMCEVPGQCPCPGVVKLPKSLRGKYYHYQKEDFFKEEREFIEEGKEIESFEPPFVSKYKSF